MSDTLAQAYPGNPLMQDQLNSKVDATALALPIPAWFLNLRLATKDLVRPSVDDSVLNALVQHARTVTSRRNIKTQAQEEIEAAKEAGKREDADSKDSAAIERANARAFAADQRAFAAENREKIWRKQAMTKTQLSINSSKRVITTNASFKKGVATINKKLESLEGKLKKAQKDGDEEAAEKITGDLSKTKEETEKAEKTRVKLLEDESSVLQAKFASLQDEKEKLEKELAVTKTEQFSPDAHRIGILEQELGILREDHDLLTAEKYSLKDKCVELEKKRADAQADFDSLDKRAKEAKANSDARLSCDSPDKGKKRAAEDEDEDTGGAEKKAKTDSEMEDAGSESTMLGEAQGE